MKKSNLTVLRGGLLDSAIHSKKEFVSAYITNTRLMGVVGMHIHFHLLNNNHYKDFHQFFYFDAEEYGFENYRSVLGNDQEEIKEIEGSLFGGLGGEKVPLTYEEAKAVLHEYVLLNKERGILLPQGLREYRFLIDKEVLLSEPEYYILQAKQCVKLDSEYELANYFLMRCFGKDFTAASYLTASGAVKDPFPSFKAATFLKNNIKIDPDDGALICESLIETEDEYHVTVTSIQVNHMKVQSCEPVSTFRISSAEALMLLTRPEYISLYEIEEDLDDFGRKATDLTAGAMITQYDSGTLYMIFQPHNKHVNKENYRLNEDILGMYFHSNNGQFLCVAYSIDDVLKLEWDLVRSPYRKRMKPVDKYQFPHPVVYDFIQSCFPDFKDYAEVLSPPEE